jgi:hypothetical protein
MEKYSDLNIFPWTMFCIAPHRHAKLLSIAIASRSVELNVDICFIQCKFNLENNFPEAAGEGLKAIFKFGSETDVHVKVAISPVDIDGAL